MADLQKLVLKKVAVLGAGVMGAQIAAHLINANIPTILFDMPGEDANKNSIVDGAIIRLKKLKPNPLSLESKAAFLEPANYATDLAKLAECDLVIEAVAEKLEIKQSLYNSVVPHLKPSVIFVTNTSGLSVNKLSQILPAALQSRFCGVHFFNPPRYMKLVELIPSEKTDKLMLDQLETFIVSSLGKVVVRAKDTPNFVGNRIGVFSLLSTLYHAEQFGIDLEVVDALTGPAIGRAKSATFRTLDVVGLDTMAHVVNTMNTQLAADPWHSYFQLPEWINKLIQNGALGQKTGAGIYKKQGKTIQVFDIKDGVYRDANRQASEEIQTILKIKDPKQKFEKLHLSKSPEAQFLWACFRDLFHYSAYHLAEIAETVRDVDFAIRYGFGWKAGVFETWQSADYKAITQIIEKEITDKKTMAAVTLPTWVKRDQLYQNGNAFAPHTQTYVGRSSLPVYQRQYYPDPVITEQFDEGKTIFENEGIRLWHLQSDIAIISFKTKMNTIGIHVLEGIQEAIRIAEKDYRGLVLWQRQGEHFSVGADLAGALQALSTGQASRVHDLVVKFQQTTTALRYSQVPTVAAIRGYVFGGGCELMMHCDRTVAALESYVGLVEAGVGLLPAGGGTKEFALRASKLALRNNDDPFRYLQHSFKTIAMAETATSAEEAKAKGFICSGDPVIFNDNELLYVAINQARAMADYYSAPLSPKIKVAGKTGIATMQMLLVNYRDGGFISEHDYLIGMKIAEVICGGYIETGCEVNEDWLLRLEVDNFMALAETKKTQERIAHTLSTGKPLRN